jgi:transcription termination factor NusA
MLLGRIDTMSADLTVVSGIGGATAAILAERGIKTVRALARMSVSELVQVKGFSDAKAKSVIASAQQLDSTPGTPAKASTSGRVKAAAPATRGKPTKAEKSEKESASKKKDKGSKKKKGKKGKKGKKKK